MPGSIKWSKSQSESLSKAVKRYNDKIRRELKKNPSLQYFLPPKVKVKEIKSQISTPNELRLKVNSLNRIYKEPIKPVITKGGVLTTNYELNELKIKNRYINKKRKEQLKRIPEQPEKYGTMGSIEQNTLKPRKFNADKINQKAFEKFKELVEKQLRDDYFPERTKRYARNYKKALYATMGDESLPLMKMLKLFTAEEIEDAFYTNPFLGLTYIYPKNKESDEERHDTLNVIHFNWFEELKDVYKKSDNDRRAYIKNFLEEEDYDVDWKSWNLGRRKK